MVYRVAVQKGTFSQHWYMFIFGVTDVVAQKYAGLEDIQALKGPE